MSSDFEVGCIVYFDPTYESNKKDMKFDNMIRFNEPFLVSEPPNHLDCIQIKGNTHYYYSIERFISQREYMFKQRLNRMVNE